ncbi:MAG: hypothetical protein VX255_11135 [Candidatus Latescibacterota bacterium]|nr:hypothetical protein [Candidatus Latescibacterota bacterium]
MTIQARQFVEQITTSEQTMRIDVGGRIDGEMTRDPVGYGYYGQSWENMVGLSLENVGDEEVLDAWVRVEGRPVMSNMETILDSILAAGMDDASKARAIWDFARHYRYHSTTGDDEVKDTVKMLNSYGYTLCWDEAFTVSNLWQAAGLKVRRGLPHGHCTSEVFYDGDYHLLDSDEHLQVLDRDNLTIASEGQISADHDLMKRSHAYGIGAAENRETTESAASLFCFDGPRSGTREPVGDHRMEINLRPGERLEWGWSERGKYHGFGSPPPRFANGLLHWSVPLAQTRWALSSTHVSGTTEGLVAEGQGEVAYEIRSPYVLVGGQLLSQVEGDGVWSMQKDGEDEWQTLSGDGEINLDDLLPPASVACYRFRLRLQGTDWTLRSLTIENDLQMAPLALPALCVGTNQVHYSDGSDARQVRLTYRWQERDDWKVPSKVDGLTPDAGQPQAASRVRLTWAPGEGAQDYHFRLGLDTGAEHALSPVFDKIVSKTASAGECFWVAPEEGLLNPETAYYWKVRGRSPEGVWGPWSEPAHFRVAAPGLPVAASLAMDGERRIGVLQWHPNAQGTPPVAYEIHGSDERGFSARRESYEMLVSNEAEPHRQTEPSNLLAVIDAGPNPQFQVIGPTTDEALARPYYRIVAVDEAGVRSGPTSMIEAPRPFITTPLPPQIAAGETTTVQVSCLRSRGDLRAQSEGPRRYFQAFRDGDQVEFLLDEGPNWISLDAVTGCLSLSPPAKGALGNHTVTLRVHNGRGGVDVVGWDVQVHPPLVSV